MITPIITSITREVFATTPTSLKEAAYGLGSTRWEMIRGAVFPHSRGGVVSAVMIGLGRAIGETIAVALGDRRVAQHHAEHPRARRHDGRARSCSEFGEAERHPPVGAHRPRRGAVRADDPRRDRRAERRRARSTVNRERSRDRVSTRAHRRHRGRSSSPRPGLRSPQGPERGSRPLMIGLAFVVALDAA